MDVSLLFESLLDGDPNGFTFGLCLDDFLFEVVRPP